MQHFKTNLEDIYYKNTIKEILLNRSEHFTSKSKYLSKPI